jgi:hypothetical protein
MKWNNKNVKSVGIKPSCILAFFITLLILYGCATTEIAQPVVPDKPEVIDPDQPVTTEPNQTGVKVDDSVIGFANMEIDNPDLKLTEEQKLVVKYFDTDYFYIGDFKNLEKYPKAFRNAQIVLEVNVEKVIKQDDDTFECIARDINEYTEGQRIIDMDESIIDFDSEGVRIREDLLSIDRAGGLIYLSGQQGDARVTNGDVFTFYGRYIDVEEKTIDGKTYQLPSCT